MLLFAVRIGIEGDIGRTVYLITPTFTRPSQYPDLTRMAQTVMAAGKGLHWLVIEDAAENTDIVRGILQRNMPYNHTLMHCRPQKRDEAYFKVSVHEEVGIQYLGSKFRLNLFCHLPSF